MREEREREREINEEGTLFTVKINLIFLPIKVGFLNVLSKSGSDPEHLDEYAQVARIVVEEGFDCEQVIIKN